MIGLKKLAPNFQPIGWKTKTNPDLVISVFPRLKQFPWFWFGLLLANWDIILLVLIDRCDFSGPGLTTFNRKALYWLITSPSSKNGLKRWATTCLLMLTWQHTQPLPATVIKGSLLNMTWPKEQLAEQLNNHMREAKSKPLFLLPNHRLTRFFTNYLITYQKDNSDVRH